MCKPFTPAMAQRDREIRRMRQAAEHPGVVEFCSMVADARRLAFRINQWIDENPANESTGTIAALRVAMEETDYVEVSEAHRVLSSLGWMLESASSVITGMMLVQVFPNCFEDLEDTVPTVQPPSKLTTRKPAPSQCPVNAA